MIISTTSSLDNKNIKEYRGVVFGEVICGIDFIKDFTAGITNFVGGRAEEYEEELVLRNKYLEILLQDFTGIKDDILNKTIGSFYNDSENKKHDDYSFVKR